MKDKHYYKDGSVLDYYYDDKILHREDGPAVEYADGGRFWWIDGKRHREDGPAVEYTSGNKAWYINGKRHRLDGPTIEYAGGGKEWWIDDRFLTEEEFNNHPKVQHYRFQMLLEEVLCER